MKSFKFLATAGFLSAALLQNASAATQHIYVTGSSAYRSAAIAAINTALGLSGPTGDDTAATTGPKNTSFIWEGGKIPASTGTAVTVVATFTGSASGVQVVTDPSGPGLAIPFLPDGSAGHAVHAAYDDSVASTPHTGYPTAIPDFCFTDAYQATTPFSADNGYIDTTSDGHDFIVGIVTFKWAASKNFPLGGGTGSVSKLSIEPNFINALFSVGVAPLSMITGSSGDRHIEVFATGRNPDSGTRIGALADSLYGVSNAVVQYQASPELTATGGNVTTHHKYPVENINGIGTGSAGNSGQASGGTLRNYMTVTLATSGLDGQGAGTTAAYYLTYLGISDFAAVSASGAVELAYKGVNYSDTAIRDGQYTFWGYEHVLDRGDLSGVVLTFETTVVNNVKAAGTDLSSVGLHNDTNMKVTRAGDGAVILPQFSF